MKTSQGEIAVWDLNEKQPQAVLFIHGHCTNKSFFSKQLNSHLLSKFRLIALDLPGYGESDPPKSPIEAYSFPGYANVVAEVVKLMKLDSVVVVGWSLGGHVGLELTSRLPQLKGLLITGTPPIEISAEGLSRGFKIANPKILECFGKGNLTYEEAELFATISGYDYTDEKRFLVEAILQTDEGAKTIYPRSILNGVGQNELDIVKEWPNPIAVILGENEQAINNDYIIHEVKFRNLWENKVHVIPEAGHAVFMERPDEFNRLLQRFINKIIIQESIGSFELLKNCPQAVPVLAEWVYQEWRSYDALLTKEKLIESFSKRLNDDRLPLTIVALKDGEPIGTVSLKEQEDPEIMGHSNGNPWLGSLQVISGERGKCLGTELLNTAKKLAYRLGYQSIFLYTSNPDNVKWYCDRGASVVETRPYRNHSITIMDMTLIGG